MIYGILVNNKHAERLPPLRWLLALAPVHEDPAMKLVKMTVKGLIAEHPQHQGG